MRSFLPKPTGTAAYLVEAMDTGYIQRIDEEALLKAAASREAMVRPTAVPACSWYNEIRSRPSGQSLGGRNRSASTFAWLCGSEPHARWNKTSNSASIRACKWQFEGYRRSATTHYGDARAGRHEHRDALRRHALETRRASQTNLRDSMDIEHIERAFTDTMRTLAPSPQPYSVPEKRNS